MMQDSGGIACTLNNSPELSVICYSLHDSKRCCFKVRNKLLFGRMNIRDNILDSVLVYVYRQTEPGFLVPKKMSSLVDKTA